MKTNMHILLSLVWAAGATWGSPALAAGPAPIDLKSCATFTIVAGSTITSIGGGTIHGNIGLFPAGEIAGFPPAVVTGTIYNGGPVAAQAQLDLNDAFIASSPAQLPGGANVGAELGGLTLVAGVYQSPSGAYDITSVNLTLDGGPDDVWVFQMASTLTVGVGRQVVLTGGAQARNIFWQVGSSATLGTSSVFKGNILAYASITMNASSSLDGRALAQTGAVTFNGDGGNLPEPEPPRFTDITTLPPDAVAVVLDTTPYFHLTLQSSPAMAPADWTTIAAETPVSTPWSYTNNGVTADVTTRFYRAFLTIP
jgi:hypothetical protein